MSLRSLTRRGSIFQLDVPFSKNIVKHEKNRLFSLKQKPACPSSKARGSSGSDFAGVTVQQAPKESSWQPFGGESAPGSSSGEEGESRAAGRGNSPCAIAIGESAPRSAPGGGAAAEGAEPAAAAATAAAPTRGGSGGHRALPAGTGPGSEGPGQHPEPGAAGRAGQGSRGQQELPRRR